MASQLESRHFLELSRQFHFAKLPLLKLNFEKCLSFTLVQIIKILVFLETVAVFLAEYLCVIYAIEELKWTVM